VSVGIVCHPARTTTRGSGLNVGNAFPTGLGKMLLVPGEGSIRRIDLMFDLGQAVSFARITKEYRLDAYVFESNEKLFRFRDGNVVVILAMDDESRSVSGTDMLQR
jgi:hypothetical protein